MDGESVDEILVALGKWGRWQILQATLLSLTYIPLAFQYTSIVFIGYEPGYRCPQNGSEEAYPADEQWDTKECSTTANSTSQSCRGMYEFNEPRYISIASEWNLVCDSSYLIQMSQTFLSLGFIIGYLFLPLADRYGRKRTLVVSHWLLLIVAGTTALSPNIIAYICFRFVLGCLFPIVNILMCLMLLELFPMTQRATVTMLSKFVWAAGIILLTLVAFSFRSTSWRYFQLCITTFSSLVVIHTFVLDESIRWLLAVNRKKDAIKVLRRAAKMNGIDFKNKIAPLVEGYTNSVQVLGSVRNLNRNVSIGSLFFSSLPDLRADGFKKNDPRNTNSLQRDVLIKHSDNAKEKGENGDMIHNDAAHGEKGVNPHFLDLFRHSTLRKYIIICSYMLFVDVMLYYGLLLMSSSLAGNRFINVLLSGAVEIPAYVICMYVLERFGRKPCLLGFHVLTGGMLVLAIIVNVTGGPELLVTAFATLGKFGSCGTLIIIFLHSSELIPTNVRAIGTGFTGSFASIGGLLAPFSSYLVQWGVWVPGTIFAACCCTVCVLLIFLPETRGRRLPQTIADLDSWGRKHHGETSEKPAV